MWLLISEPQSAWLVLSHDQGAPPVIRFHQPFGSWACSSQHPLLLPPTLIQSTGAHFILSTNQRLYFLFSTQLLCQREQPLAYIPSRRPPPPKTGRENLQVPLSTSHQATSYLQHLHHVANLLHNSTSLTISLASLRHFYLPNVQIPQNSKLLLSCSL